MIKITHFKMFHLLKTDHEKRSQIVTSKTSGRGGKMGSPSSGFPCSGHFGRKVVNITIYKLGVADPNPISKSKFDPFLVTKTVFSPFFTHLCVKQYNKKQLRDVSSPHYEVSHHEHKSKKQL